MEYSCNGGLGDDRGEHRVVAPVEFDRRDGKLPKSSFPFPGHPGNLAERSEIAHVYPMNQSLEDMNLGEVHSDPE